MVAMHLENKSKSFGEMDGVDDCQRTDVTLLDESDIAGASLNGKSPSELSVTQLKRWLACRGAPVTRGKKPELIER